MKTLKEVAHLYLGQYVSMRTPMITDYHVKMEVDVLKTVLDRPKDFKLFLRPLSSITEQEIDKGRLMVQINYFVYLLSLGIDLFGLIESEQAIDITKNPIKLT